MKVERRIVKSISEFSVFKFVLVAYLIFFILFVVIFAIIGLIGWALIASSGVVLADVLNSLIPGLNLSEMLGGLGNRNGRRRTWNGIICHFGPCCFSICSCRRDCCGMAGQCSTENNRRHRTEICS